MALNITDFIAHVKRYNVARPNKYEIVFSTPPNLINRVSDAMKGSTDNGYNEEGGMSPIGTGRMISLSCLSAEMPGIMLATTDVAYGSTPRKLPHDRIFSEFHTTFLVTGEMNEKKFFDAWIGTIFDNKTHRVMYQSDYVTSIYVSMLNTADKRVLNYELTEAFPVAINAIPLDKTSQNTHMLLDVTWAYHKVRNEPNKYDARDVMEADKNADTSKRIRAEHGVTAKDLNLPTVPDVHFAQIEINDILKAARRVADQVKRGEMTPENALRLVRQLTNDFKALTGVPPGIFEDVTKILGDVSAGMPIKIPGIGNVPIRLP